MKKLVGFTCFLAVMLFLPSSINAQEAKTTDENRTPVNMEGKGQQADEQTMAQFKSIADKHAKDLGTKLNLEEDDVEEIRESIVEYFDDRWESRVDLSDELGDKDETLENEEDLADERVELAGDIEEELDDNQQAQWQQMKTEWWTSLDNDFFKVMTEGKANMEKKEMKSEKEHSDKNME